MDGFIDGIQKDIAAGKTDNIDPVKRWEGANNIPAKRVEAQAQATKDRETQIRAEERAAVLSEQAIPGQPRQGEHAPVFKGLGESKLQRPQPGNRLSGAVSALATGRYSGKKAS